MYTSNLLQTYPRVGGGPGGHAGLPDSLYNPAAAAAYAAQGYMPFGPPDSSAFYSPLVRVPILYLYKSLFVSRIDLKIKIINKINNI